MTTNAQLGQAIRTLRESAGHTQEQMTERTGIAQGQISKIERGGCGVSLPRLSKIASALGLRISDIYAKAEGVAPPPKPAPASQPMQDLQPADQDALKYMMAAIVGVIARHRPLEAKEIAAAARLAAGADGSGGDLMKAFLRVIESQAGHVSRLRESPVTPER